MPRQKCHMFYFALKRGGETGIPKALLTKLDLFNREPALKYMDRYAIRTDVDPKVFAMFLTGVYGKADDVDVNIDNVEQLRAICDELGFSELDDEIRAVLARGGDLRMRKELVCVRDRVDRHDVFIEQLQRRVLELERLLQEVRNVPQRAEPVERRLEVTPQGPSELQPNDAGAPVERMTEVRAPAIAAQAEALAKGIAHLKGSEAQRGTAPRQAAVTSQTPGMEIVYDAAKPLEGIITHLTRQCGGNVQEKGVVEVRASSCMSSWKPENAVTDDRDLRFASKSEPNSWICYTFKGKRVALTGYSILADTCAFPKSWVLEVSNDGTSWDVADRRDGNEDLNTKFAIHHFVIGTPPRGSFSMIRLRQTGKNHGGHDGLCLNFFEVFGTLFTQ